MGETVIEVPVSPVDHEYMPPPLAVSVVLPPLQIVPGLTVIMGAALTVTVPVFVVEQPDDDVPVTEYVVVELGET